jgi:hypothetical protein
VSRLAGQNLDGGEDGLLTVLACEHQVQQSIRPRRNVGEDLYVGGCAGPGVGHNVEAAQQGSAVGTDSHDAAAFAACSGRFRPIDRFGKVQA